MEELLFAGTVWVVRPREERREVSLLLSVDVRREMGSVDCAIRDVRSEMWKMRDTGDEGYELRDRRLEELGCEHPVS